MDIVREYVKYNGVYYDKALLPYVNHFSLKKLGKKIGNVAKDAVQMGAAPVKLAVASVTGKPAKIKYNTKLGKVVGGIHDESTKKLTATVKRVGDTITLGGASKLANVVRKKEYKEKPGQYNELRPSNTGVKFIDKLSDKMNPVTQVAGTIAGGYTLASGVKTLAGKTNIPASALSQVAEYAKVGLSDDPSSYRDTQLLEDMKNGNEIPGGEYKNKLGSFFSGEMSPIVIIIAIVLLVIAVSASGKGKGSTSNYRRK